MMLRKWSSKSLTRPTTGPKGATAGAKRMRTTTMKIQRVKEAACAASNSNMYTLFHALCTTLNI